MRESSLDLRQKSKEEQENDLLISFSHLESIQAGNLKFNKNLSKVFFFESVSPVDNKKHSLHTGMAEEMKQFLEACLIMVNDELEDRG